ncbi:ATP-dependent DNA helicase RecQ [Shewanella piezotolerans WP3]|uniref:DNA 3'-5' helicase n=1 Tax=Shewanella piezotolerans (strain WP3 / JCM 13877) TaxID=225849 RepID=B8CP91_SHEPW|nr:RecQ family ATP-dependent DNA helicase [Shewanella piezotolerans]ACJ29335.1 ATP-dependent DNA helicase RecQ [Shewanella piezotolerans WP3]
MHNAHALLKQYFGFNAFREGQEQVVSNILNGLSAAAIFPTGSGKSLCYQLPATVLPHLTLVVSPLLALMQDQLAFLKTRGISAASIDSTQTPEEAASVLDGVSNGSIKVLMISVERLNNERFRRFIGGIEISLLVVDEAHCISEWGHNFRPDYLKLPSYQRELNISQVLLLTATATSKVIADMSSKFAIDDNSITLTGFYRPNLHLNAIGIEEASKQRYLTEWLQTRKLVSGIIYVTLQKSAESVASQLQRAGYSVMAYHAGMDSEQRKAIQTKFMSGEVPIIVATIAFGMGIDKSDIRFVVHYDLPKSIENYAQEIGRAGRDGSDSECLVLANKDNLNVLENFVYGDTPELSAICTVIEQIKEQTQQSDQWELMLNQLSSTSNIRPLSLKTLLVYLEMQGVIKAKYSYFAEYKYKLQTTLATLMSKFDPERQQFINAIIDTSAKAKIWYSADLKQLETFIPNSRGRAIKALDYLDQKQLIELQSKQLTQVYDVYQDKLQGQGLAESLFNQFTTKERSEIDRINFLVNFFGSSHCLSLQLAQYFSDPHAVAACGSCSVCLGHLTQLPEPKQLQELDTYDFDVISADAISKLKTNDSAVLLTRFLCGLTTPIFTKLKMRQTYGFAKFEHYRFKDVFNWVNKHKEK